MLPNHVMRALRYIEISTAKKTRNLRVGSYTSRLRGSGFDFDEHRLYRAGDDVRRIDWNVTARLNLPFVRETHAERELNAMIVVDLSRSMAYGTAGPSKQEQMLFIAACLVFSAICDHINVGVLAFNDRVLRYDPPRRSRGRAWHILGELWSVEPHGRTSLGPALRHVARSLKKTSVVFVLSDFMLNEDVGAMEDLKMLATKHDIVGVVVEDPAEAVLPPGHGAVMFKDVESGAQRRVGLNQGVRDRYAAAMRQRREDLARSFYRVPMDCVFARAGHDAAEPLIELFASRRHP